MRGWVLWFLLVGTSVVVATLHGSARAQGAAPLRVERGAGAEECADAANLAERIARIRGRADTQSSSQYEVRFTHTADAFSAAIRSAGNGETERVLSGRGPSCSAVSQAAAVTLALLFDSEAVAPPAKREPEPEPAPEPREHAAAVPAPVPAPLELAPAPPLVGGTLSLGVAGLAFVLRPFSPAFSAEVGVRVEGFRLGLGVLWSPTQSLPLDPGRVNESLFSGSARACVALSRSARLQLDVCSGLLAGAVTAQAEGFTDNEQQRRAFLAIPLELSLADLSGSLGWEVSATALGSLAHQDFQVEGLGIAYRAPRVGALLTLRIVGLLSEARPTKR